MVNAPDKNTIMTIALIEIQWLYSVDFGLKRQEQNT
jgi:hypothetical protein